MRRTCASGGGRKGALPARFPLSVAAHTWSRIVRPRACGSPRRGRAGPARPPARPGTKGGGAATRSPADTPLTPRSPPPPARAQHPGPVRPPARSPTPPPPRPSRPLAPGGPPPPLPADPPAAVPPAPTRCCPVLSPPAGACGAPGASPDNKGGSGLPLPGTGGDGEPARGGGTRAPQVPAGKGASAGSQPGPGVPRRGVGEQSSFLPFFPAPHKHPQTSARTHPPRCGTSSGSVPPPPAPRRRGRKGRGRGVLQAWHRGGGGGGGRRARLLPLRAPPAGRGQPRGRSPAVPAPLPSPGSPGSNRRPGSPSPARPSSLGSRLGTARRGGAVISPSPSHTHALPPAPSPSRRPFLPPLRAAAPPRPPGRCSPAADHPPPSLPSSAAGPGTC